MLRPSKYSTTIAVTSLDCLQCFFEGKNVLEKNAISRYARESEACFVDEGGGEGGGDEKDR